MAQPEIAQLIEEVLAGEPDLDIFLVESIWQEKSDRLVVYLDSDQGLTLAACQRINRALARKLDETEALGTNYALEVSSAGLERPLKLHRQYLKNIGRVVRVKTVNGETWEGRLAEVEKDQILLNPEHIKKKSELPKHIPFELIEKTFVQARFK